MGLGGGGGAGPGMGVVWVVLFCGGLLMGVRPLAEWPSRWLWLGMVFYMMCAAAALVVWPGGATAVSPWVAGGWGHWWRDGAGLLLLVYFLQLRVRGSAVMVLGLGFLSAVAVYTLLAIVSEGRQEEGVKEAGFAFGFFPNRNHTGTLLAMGCVVGVAVAFQATRLGKYGMAGMGAVAVGVLLWGAAGYNLSRSWFILTGGGLVVWAVGVGGDWISRRMMGVLVGAGVMSLLLVAGMNEGVRKRMGGDENRGATRVMAVVGADAAFRWEVWREAVAMTNDHGWTGVGRGSFAEVFPKYRVGTMSANDKTMYHPESDWLLVAAECGWGAMVVVLGGVGWLFFRGWREARSSPARPVRLGCLVAAGLVPVHGLIDVPGHELSLLCLAAVLLGLAGREPEAGVRRVRLGWVGCGVIVLGIAVWGCTEWVKNGERRHPWSAVGLMEETRILTEEGKLDEAERAMLFHQELEPRRVRVPLRQATLWAACGEVSRLSRLWEEAMRRAAGREGEFAKERVMREILETSGRGVVASSRARELIGADVALAAVWARWADPAAVGMGLPELLLGRFANEKDKLWAAWRERDTEAAARWREAHPF